MGNNNWPLKVVCPACGQEAKCNGSEGWITFQCHCPDCNLDFDISANKNAFDIAVKFARHEPGFTLSEPV